MCDPVTVGSAVVMGAGTALNAGAQSKARKAAAATQAKSLVTQREEFNRRQGYLEESDKRVDALLDAEYADQSKLTDDTFAYLLNNSKTAFDTQMSELDGLMTETRRARLEQAALIEAENQRQLAFQGEADSLAGALPGKIGYDAQQTMRAAEEAARNVFTRESASAADGTGYTAGVGDLVQRLYEEKAAEGRTRALESAEAQNKVAAYGDALVGANRELAGFGDAITALGMKAGFSRAPLSAELRVPAIAEANARAGAGERIEASNNLYQGLNDAQSSFADNMRATLNTFFGRSYDSENRATGGKVESSQNYENKITGLNNYKAANTTGSSTLGTILSTAGQVGMMSGIGGKLSTAFARVPRVVSPAFLNASNQLAPYSVPNLVTPGALRF